MILPTLIFACCIDSPPFVPVSQPATVEAGDGLTPEILNKLEPGVVYAITRNGEYTGGTVEVDGQPVVTEIFSQPDPAAAEQDSPHPALGVSP